MQQRLFAPGADAGNLVQRRADDRLRSAGAMAADRETMRLVAQSLQEVEHRVALGQGERLAPGLKELLASGIAIRPLGNRDDGHLRDAELGEGRQGRAKLPLAAVDQQQIRPLAGSN